jgi:hypothetical protein
MRIITVRPTAEDFSRPNRSHHAPLEFIDCQIKHKVSAIPYLWNPILSCSIDWCNFNNPSQGLTFNSARVQSEFMVFYHVVWLLWNAIDN